MNQFDQIPFRLEFAENPEPRCPCILLLDNSGSMSGQKIEQLNKGIQEYFDSIAGDCLAEKRVETTIISFGPVETHCEFVQNSSRPNSSRPSIVLEPRGSTPMGEAIELAVAKLQVRKQEYKAGGIAYYRPWIFLVTDGEPTDDVRGATQLVHRGDREKQFSFFAVGVEGADMDTLNAISPPGKRALSLRGLEFGAMFRWLSASLKSVSASQLGDTIALDNPAVPDGWASIE